MAEKPGNHQSGLDLIEYPSRFPLKVFGDQSTQFEDTVLELVKARSPKFDQQGIKG